MKKIQNNLQLIYIYTVDSKDGNKVAATAEVNNDIFSVRILDEATLFTAEDKEI